jgi:outer membrane PBP1 activator LpoA protein
MRFLPFEPLSAPRALRVLVATFLTVAAMLVAGAFCAAAEPATSASPLTLQGRTGALVVPDAAPPTTAVRRDGPDIVLILPLDSPDYAKAADAVRAGFIDAAEAANAKGKVVVVSHGDKDMLAAFRKARDDGAKVIVGPLVRDQLKALALSNLSLPPTLALNQLDDGTPLPPGVYALALAIESDANVIARQAHDDGSKVVAVVSSETPLMKRFASAFVGEWLLSGGNAPKMFTYDATPDGLAALRRDLAKVAGLDALVIAVEGSDAALVKTFAPRVTTYASAQVNQRQAPAALRDLDDVRIVDLPWLVDPDAPAFAQMPHRSFGSVGLDRLYALGLDAFRVATAFVPGVPAQFELKGATGNLALKDNRQISREGELAVFRNGRLVPFQAQ